MTKKKAVKIKMTLKFPRCVACRERSVEGDLPSLLDMVERLLQQRTGKGIPLTITLVKL